MSSTKTAIVVLSDPNGGEEALGRVFNALAAAYDFKQKHQDVQLLFQGAGTRWAGAAEQGGSPRARALQGRRGQGRRRVDGVFASSSARARTPSATASRCSRAIPSPTRPGCRVSSPTRRRATDSDVLSGPCPDDPFHEGEIAVQERAGERDIGRRPAHDHLAAHRAGRAAVSRRSSA